MLPLATGKPPKQHNMRELSGMHSGHMAQQVEAMLKYGSFTAGERHPRDDLVVGDAILPTHVKDSSEHCLLELLQMLNGHIVVPCHGGGLKCPSETIWSFLKCRPWWQGQKRGTRLNAMFFQNRFQLKTGMPVLLLRNKS